MWWPHALSYNQKRNRGQELLTKIVAAISPQWNNDQHVHKMQESLIADFTPLCPTRFLSQFQSHSLSICTHVCASTKSASWADQLLHLLVPVHTMDPHHRLTSQSIHKVHYLFSMFTFCFDSFYVSNTVLLYIMLLLGN